MIRQRQIERRKAKRLASTRMVSYSQSNGPYTSGVTGGYGDEEGQEGDVFAHRQQDQGRYASQQYSVPSTPMVAGSRSAGLGLHTPGPGQAGERHVSSSGRKRGGAETPGGYFPPFGSIERGGSEWGGASASGGDESGGATPLAGGHPHHQQQGGRSSSQAGYTRQGFVDKPRTAGRGTKTPRLGPTTPGTGLGGGFRIDSPSLGPSGGGYGGEDGVGKAASVIEQVVSELGSGDRRDMEDGGGEDDEEEEEDDDEEVDEEGVTVRDRQDVSHAPGSDLLRGISY